jgi:hypothetical protein
VPVIAAVSIPAAAVNTVTQSITGGALSASVADLTFTPVAYSHSEQVSTGTLTLTADDSSGEDLGWNVTLQSGDFAYSGSSPNGTAIPGANLIITGANPPELVSGEAIDASGGPKALATGATGSLDTPRSVLQASPAYGAGQYQQTLDVSLTIPAGSRPGTYSGTLAVSITAGP